MFTDRVIAMGLERTIHGPQIVGTTQLRRTPARDRAELRGMVHEDVLKMTTLRREVLWTQITTAHQDWTQAQVEAEVDRLQPAYVEYDPVVAMAVMSANHEHPVEVRLRAMAESAQYLRPKLKSIEMVVGDGDPTEQAFRRALADELVGLLDAGAAAKRATTIDGTASPSPDTASPADEPETHS